MVELFWWGLIGFAVLIPASRLHFERLSIFAVAMVARMAAVVASSVSSLNPFNEGDAIYFERVASERAADRSALDLVLTSDWLEFGNRWITLLALLFGLGMSVFQVEVINALISSFAIAMLRPIGSSQRWIWFFLAVSPFAAGLHGSLLREAPVFATATIAALYLSDRRVSYPTALAASLACAAFHPGMIPLLIVTAASGRRTLADRLAGHRIARTSTLIGIMIVLSIVITTGFGLERLENQEIEAAALEERFARANRGRQAYELPSPVSLSPEGFLFLPVRILYFLGGPMPNRVASVRDALAALDGLVFLIVGAKLSRRMFRGRRALAAVALIGSLLIFAVAVSNFGTALRHRHKLVPVAVATAFACGALDAPAQPRRRTGTALSGTSYRLHDPRSL